ncbi:MAG: hypothetical protein ABIL11_05390 [Chloroflexota bacterium]
MISAGEFLPLRPRGLITIITLPLNVKFAFEYVSRTPSDKPIVCAALAQWTTGRSRLAVGDYGICPMLAMDGTESEGLEAAARNACHERRMSEPPRNTAWRSQRRWRRGV